MSSHVVLGGNGVVGREIIASLLALGHSVVSVGRSPSPLPGVESLIADVRDAAAVRRAVQGAEVAYLTVGLPYKTKVWRRDWPVVIQNAIDACLEHDAHLVFLDNVYAYGNVSGPMTEQTPIKPSSAKGEVRAALLRMLEAASRDGLVCTVARSADFYGPGASTSVFNSMALDRIATGRAPSWLFDATQPHSMTYTPDIGRALAILGTDPRGRGGTWHVPTAPALTGEEYVALASGGGIDLKTMSMATMRMGAIFMSIARESLELSYQNTQPYVFDSSRFETTFGMTPTPYREGIARALEPARRG